MGGLLHGLRTSYTGRKVSKKLPTPSSHCFFLASLFAQPCPLAVLKNKEEGRRKKG